jgi:hypothetical protein
MRDFKILAIYDRRGAYLFSERYGRVVRKKSVINKFETTQGRK